DAAAIELGADRLRQRQRAPDVRAGVLGARDLALLLLLDLGVLLSLQLLIQARDEFLLRQLRRDRQLDGAADRNRRVPREQHEAAAGREVFQGGHHPRVEAVVLTSRDYLDPRVVAALEDFASGGERAVEDVLLQHRQERLRNQLAG